MPGPGFPKISCLNSGKFGQEIRVLFLCICSSIMFQSRICHNYKAVKIKKIQDLADSQHTKSSTPPIKKPLLQCNFLHKNMLAMAILHVTSFKTF
jgi:hypothetical protein